VSIRRIGKELIHPMAHPLSYMRTAFNSFQQNLVKNSISAADYLVSLEEPKDKYIESEPTEKVRKEIVINRNIVYSFEKRILAVHLLGKYKCQECIDTLIDLMHNDHVFDVRALAYEKLIRFGLDVGPQLKKPSHHTDPQITQKIKSVGFSSEQVKTKEGCERAINEFRKKYPIEYDRSANSEGFHYFRSPNCPLDALAVGLKWRNGNFGGSGGSPLLVIDVSLLILWIVRSKDK